MRETVTLPFNKVATHDIRRTPHVLLNQDVKDWIEDKPIRNNWLMGSYQDAETWKVRFEFMNKADAILFKLTFGGA